LLKVTLVESRVCNLGIGECHQRGGDVRVVHKSRVGCTLVSFIRLEKLKYNQQLKKKGFRVIVKCFRFPTTHLLSVWVIVLLCI
jgi:hypothetical protein